MKIIDRYITVSITNVFLSCLLIFCFLYVLIDVASNLDEYIRGKISLEILLQYYSSLVPIIITQASPVSCLIATMLTFSHLNHHNEIVALRTCGLNFWKIAKPALTVGLIVSAVIFWVNESFVPQATVASEDIRDAKIIFKIDPIHKKKPKIEHLTFYGLKNRLYFIDKFDPNDFSLEGITIIGQDNEQNLKEKIIALKGRWTGLAWKFYQCQVSYFDTADPNIVEDIKYYEEKLMDIKETPQDFLKQRINVSSMNIKQLSDYIVRFANSGATKALNSLRVDLHQKIAFPFGNIVIVLMGLPLTMISARRKAFTFTALGSAVAIGFLFYVVNAVGLAFGKGGILPPMASAWLAPLVFLLISLYLIKTRF